ncbi:MAG: hypothetical protein ACXAC7_22070, partial [Candidatus Hodarchaeales archaeon]
MIFQITITINPLMALLETLFLIVFLILGFYIIYRLTPREFRIDVKSFSRSSTISCLICLGIIFGIKILFQILEFFHIIFTALNKDTFLFGIEVLLFTIFYRILVLRGNHKISNTFKKWTVIYVILCLTLSMLFFTIDLLDILNITLYIEPLDRPFISLLVAPLEFNDIFYLSFVSEFGIVSFCIILTYIMNRVRDIESRITRPVLKKSLMVSSFISYFLWSFLIFLFGAYLGSFFNFGGFFLDFRVQIITSMAIYFVSFFYFLKYRSIPESGEISKQKLQEAIKKKEENR